MLYGIAGLLGALVAGVCLFEYAPPYAWVADAQLAMFHTNIVAISFLVTFAITSTPFALIARVMEPRIDPTGSLARRWDGFDRFLDTWPGKMVMIGLTIAGVGGYLGYRDASRGPLQSVDVRALERGEGPSCAYVDLAHAELVWEGRIRFQENSSESSYVPVVSREDRPHAAVFAHYRRGIEEDAPLRGTLDQDDLPGEIRSAYEDAHAIESPHYVLEVGADPAERGGFAIWMGGAGLVIAIAGLAIALSLRRAA